MNVAFIGYFAPKKGSRLLKPLLDGCLKNDTVSIFGHIGDTTEFSRIHHSIAFSTRYENAELQGLLKQHKIDLGLVLSTWAETYSMTFFEAFSLGIPVITNNIGFPHFKFGHLAKQLLFFDSKNPVPSIEAQIKKFRSHPEKYQKLTQQLAERFTAEQKASSDLKYQLIDGALGRFIPD